MKQGIGGKSSSEATGQGVQKEEFRQGNQRYCLVKLCFIAVSGV